MSGFPTQSSYLGIDWEDIWSWEDIKSNRENVGRKKVGGESQNWG